MYKIILSEAAERDLHEIHDYLMEDLFNPPAALNLESEIRSTFEMLTESPYVGSICQDERLKAKEYRKCLVCNYLFIYRVDENELKVFVVRFFHGLQDWISQL